MNTLCLLFLWAVVSVLLHLTNYYLFRCNCNKTGGSAKKLVEQTRERFITHTFAVISHHCAWIWCASVPATRKSLAPTAAAAAQVVFHSRSVCIPTILWVIKRLRRWRKSLWQQWILPNHKHHLIGRWQRSRWQTIVAPRRPIRVHRPLLLHYLQRPFNHVFQKITPLLKGYWKNENKPKVWELPRPCFIRHTCRPCMRNDIRRIYILLSSHSRSWSLTHLWLDGSWTFKIYKLCTFICILKLKLYFTFTSLSLFHQSWSVLVDRRTLILVSHQHSHSHLTPDFRGKRWFFTHKNLCLCTLSGKPERSTSYMNRIGIQLPK